MARIAPPCPTCGSEDTYVFKLRRAKTTSGISRKIHCRCCRYRWHIWEGDPPVKYASPPCPTCGSQDTYIYKHYRSKTTSSLCRRLHCRGCQHRWGEWDGERPANPVQQRFPERNPLTEEQVRWILLTRSMTHAETGQALKPPKSRSTIQRVRYGTMYAHLAPDVPRWNAAGTRTCRDCCQWREGGCSLEIPEAVDEGIGFAVECALYTAVKEQPRGRVLSPATG